MVEFGSRASSSHARASQRPDLDRGACTGTEGPTQNSASGQISVSEKAKKCMENEKVLRMRIRAEKWGPKSKFGPGNSVDNRLSFPTHPGSTSGVQKRQRAPAEFWVGYLQIPQPESYSSSELALDSFLLVLIHYH